MSKSTVGEFDRNFISSLQKILTEGCEYESRAVWEDLKDRPFANCKKVFGLVTEYNSNFENTPPLSNLRKLNVNNCIDELLWIWQKKSNNIKDLNSRIWDSWADSNGSIGSAYGFQVRSKLHKVQENKYLGKDESGYDVFDCAPLYLDQIDYVIWKLKNDPFCRRIITNLYDVGQLEYMGLEPCCYMCTWNVTVDKEGTKYLNLLLNQRSQDMIVANNWNVFQYWVLQNLLANECDMKVGKLIHVIADAHIYDRHIPIAKKLISDFEILKEVEKVPTPIIDFMCKKFYDITISDIVIGNYFYLNKMTKIPVAV